jgi:cytochrome P450
VTVIYLCLGPVVRFTPNAVSINTVAAFQDIYGSRKANVVKSDWYRTIQYAERGTPSTFTAINPKQHAQKRRSLSYAFSENALRDMESQVVDHVQKWCNLLGKRATKGDWSEGRNMSTWADYLTFDVLSDLSFGKSLEISEKEDNRFIMDLLLKTTHAAYDVCKDSAGVYNASLTSFRRLGYHPCVSFLRKLLFQTPLGDLAGGQMVRDNNRFGLFCDTALAQRQEAQKDADRAGIPSSRKDIFYHLFRGKDPETGLGYTQADLEAETRLLVIAGSDTSAVALAACCFYLVHNGRVLSKLTKEIRSVFANIEDIRYAGTPLPTLSYLRACIDETLRMAPPTPGHIPREVGPGGATIDGMVFPPGTVVGISTYALHHNEEYYPDSFTFSPERWIVDPANHVPAESVAKSQSAFAAFGLGPRGCLGKNLAYMELSLALARMLWQYDVRLVEGDKTGEGGPGKAWGRTRTQEYQLEDVWLVKRDGPVVKFRAR